MPLFPSIGNSMVKTDNRLTWNELKDAVEETLRREKIPHSRPVFIDEIIITHGFTIDGIVIRVEQDDDGNDELMVF